MTEAKPKGLFENKNLRSKILKGKLLADLSES